MDNLLAVGAKIGEARITGLGQSLPHARLYTALGPQGEPLCVQQLPSAGPARDEALEVAALILIHLQHPHLARARSYHHVQESHFLVCEAVPGKLLRDVCPESGLGRVVEWGLALLEAVSYLEQHRYPAAYEILDPVRLKVCSDGRLVAFSLGLSTLLHGTPPRTFPQALARFAQTVVLMATGTERSEELPAGLLWFVARCQAADPARNYPSWEDARAGLQGLLTPDEERPEASHHLTAKPPLSDFQVPRMPSVRLLRRTPLLLGLLLAVFLGLGLYLKPPTARPVRLDEPAVLVAGSDRLLLYGGKPPRLRQTLRLPGHLQAMVALSDGSRAYLAVQGRAEVLVLDTVHMTWLGALALPAAPRCLWLDPADTHLLVLDGTGLLTAIGIRSHPRPAAPIAAVERVLGSLALPADCWSLQGVPLAPGASGSARLALRLPADLGLLVRRAPGKPALLLQASTLAALPPGALGGASLAVGVADGVVMVRPPAQALRLDTSGRVVGARALGEEILGLWPEGSEVWVLSSSSLERIDGASLRSRSRIRLPGQAVDACLSPDTLWVTWREPAGLGSASASLTDPVELPVEPRALVALPIYTAPALEVAPR